MGRRGPPKKPTTLKLVQGTPGGKHKLPAAEPSPPKARSARPPYKLNREEKKIWRQLADQLEKVGLLTIIDLNALARYCEIYAKYLMAKRFLDEKKAFYYPIYWSQTEEEIEAKTEKRVKYLAQYPEVAIMNQLAKELRALECNFGMTPAARASLGQTISGLKTPSGEEESIDEFLFGTD